MPRHDRTLDDILDPIARRLTGAAPEPTLEQDPQVVLDHIAEVSKNARATWFGLLGLLAFVGVTLLGHKDTDFFAQGAETQLPLIGITVPVTAFFYTAPVLVAALYIYLHLYLLNLWDALADAPARIAGQPLGDRVFPWLISHAALWERNRARGDRSIAPRPMGRFVVFVSLALGAAFGIAILGLLWWRSMPAHDEGLTLWIALWLFVATLVGIAGLVSGTRRMGGATRTEVSNAHGVRQTWAAAFAALLGFLSWETTEGGILNHRVTKWDGTQEWPRAVLLYPANLGEAGLTGKPAGTLSFEYWLEDFEPAYRSREGIGEGTDLTGNRAFLAEAVGRYTAPLAAPNLRGRDLRNANMLGAYLPGVDLRGAQMQGADLRVAQMQGAKLFKAQMQGANLIQAQMQGANLIQAQMQEADLSGAQMQGADLGVAQMQGADLRVAQMQGADLRVAQMQGADLSLAQMQGADLSLAQMQNAECSSATLRGALLHSANVTCRTLSPDQLKGAVGDARTLVPHGMTVASCLVSLPEDVEAALAHHPEEGIVGSPRERVRKALLCPAGEKPHATGSWPFERRYWDR